MSAISRRFGTLWFITLAFSALTVWRARGFPEEIRIPLDVLYWGMSGLGLLLTVEVFWQFVRYVYWTVRRWTVRVQLRRAKRELAEQQRRIEEQDRRIQELEREFRVLRDYD